MKRALLALAVLGVLVGIRRRPRVDAPLYPMSVPPAGPRRRSEWNDEQWAADAA